MKRGLFQEIIPEEFINSSTRNWNISLLKSLDIWGEFAYSDGKLSNYKRTIKRHIVNYIYPNDDFDRYPIYFISIRPKTRFNKFVKFLSADRKYFTLTFFEGLIPHFKKFNVEDIANFLDIDCKNGVSLQVESKYVVCSNGAEKKLVSIYDLLHAFGYHFKLKNKILYVGYSENPENRPFEGFHGGLTQILYGVFNRNMNDIFINYQQFHVNSFISSQKGIYFQASNTMLNEVDVKTETKIIESTLIKYYLEKKRKNFNKEIGYLKNRIGGELADLNIHEITMVLNYYQSNSMFRYKAPRMKNKDIPEFSIKNVDGKILLTPAST